MYKPLICNLTCLVLLIEGLSQSSSQPYLNAPYHSPTTDKQSWQRLNLFLSSTYFLAVKEGQIDIDSCLLKASSSLGLSRLSVLGEGIDDKELFSESAWINQKDPGKGVQLLSQSTGKKRLEVLLLLGAYYAFQPQSHRKSDSVEYFLNQVVKESRALKEDRLGRMALCLIGKNFIQANDLHRGDSVFSQLINDCQSASDKETEARAYAYQGIYTPVGPATLHNKITYLQKAAAIYHESKNVEGEINVLTDIGYLMVIASQLQIAYNSFLQALQLCEDIHFPYIQYNTDAIAMVTMFEGKFGEPLKYTIQTIKTAESNRDSIGWAYFYGRLSTLYRMEGGKEKESAEWMHKALDRFLVDRNPALYNLLLDLVNHMNEKGQSREAIDLLTDISKRVPPVNFSDLFFYHVALSHCYNDLHQFELAEMHLIKADSMETKAESFRGPLRRAWIYSQYGFLYFNQGQYRKARIYLEKFLLSNSPGMRIIKNDLITYRKLIQIDSLLHEPVNGLAHQKKYIQLLDSNFRVSKIRQAEELQVMYQTEEKETQIGLLNQEAKLQQDNAKQATSTRNMTIGGIIAVLIFAGLLYRQSRLRKKTNTIITHQNEQLQHFLAEKEWLLKEIHHRVKNNLQIVMSLLNSQTAFIENESALTAIHDSQHRVHAMSLIHQKLYNSENVSAIEMSIYIHELVSYLSESFNTGQRIRFEFAIEPLVMDVSQAVPLGLILNEAITNAIKYAFPDGRKGNIFISFSRDTNQHCLLSIADNGIGIPISLKNNKSESLGMSLMEGLSEDLAGNFSIENSHGTIIKVSFEYEPGVKRSAALTESLVVNN